jgi:glycosyl transferase family 2
MTPRVSVLLPVRDGAPTLADCLASLAGQTLADHEVIAVDDGSVDGSPSVLRAAARHDRRLRVLEGGRRGLVAALNLALSEARAPLLARMDADDVAHPERLAAQARRLETDRATDILGCRVRLFGRPAGDNGGMCAYVEWMNGLLEHEAIVRDLFVESPLAHPSVMLRAAVLRGLGGYRDFEGPEDYELWLRARTAGCGFAKLPETLLDWRDPPGRLSRCDARYAPARFQATKIEALERRALPFGRPVVIWGAGPVGKGWARALLARGHRVAGFVDVDPRKLGNRVHGAPVLAVGPAACLDGALHLGAVGRAEARPRVRAAAAALGLQDGHDFLAVA